MTMPPPVTPAAAPSDPAGFASVTPHGQGPAPYDIQAPRDDLAGVFSAAGEASGGEENDLYAAGPRQAQAADVMESPAGYGQFDILEGFSGQGETAHGWPNDVRPAREFWNGGDGGA